MPDAPRDAWSKGQAGATIFATVAVPLILSVAGYLFNDSLKERDVKLRTTELAIAVLREEPKPNAETPLLRRWAADVIDEYSGVPFPEGAKEELTKHAIDFMSIELGKRIQAIETEALAEVGDIRRLIAQTRVTTLQNELGELGWHGTLNCDEIASSDFDPLDEVRRLPDAQRTRAMKLLVHLSSACGEVSRGD